MCRSHHPRVRPAARHHLGRGPRTVSGTVAVCRDFPTAGKGARESSEIHLIKGALERHKNNRQGAAAELGISRVSLYKRLHKYGLFDRQ